VWWGKGKRWIDAWKCLNCGCLYCLVYTRMIYFISYLIQPVPGRGSFIFLAKKKSPLLLYQLYGVLSRRLFFCPCLYQTVRESRIFICARRVHAGRALLGCLRLRPCPLPNTRVLLDLFVLAGYMHMHVYVVAPVRPGRIRCMRKNHASPLVCSIFRFLICPISSTQP
jgi:hypothetical protein